jgi:hypothetical protein
VNGLQLTRLSAAVMNEMTKHLRLGNLAEKFIGDDSADWVVHDEVKVVALKHGKFVAELHYRGKQVSIIVPDVFMLIRNEHLKEFVPEDHDLMVNEATDWKGEREPDLVVDWEIPHDLVVAQGPRVSMPRRTRSRRFKVIPSLK